MAIREILTVPNPILKQVSRPVDAVDDVLRALMDDMLETMYDAPGIGLAAIQIGEPVRVIVMDLQEKPEGSDPDAEGVKNPRYFVNPEIVWASEELAPYEEGCLSVPDFTGNDSRAERITLEACDEHGRRRQYRCTGFEARAVQHEIDHLDGLLFLDRLVSRRNDLFRRKVCK